MSIAVLHETDLFRPHEDPDDHWDLATQYALAKRGLIELKGVMIDYPPDLAHGDPDIIAVNQMNQLTGFSVPIGVGQATPDDTCEGSGVRLLVNTLRESSEPIVLHIVGSSRDVALCGRKYPELFHDKVRAVYLNAGSGVNGELEYNVKLDTAAYAAIFDLPCPVYWMPCFHVVSNDMSVGKYGTFFRFRQGDVWNEFRPEVQNYFVGVLARQKTSDWLKSLYGPVDTRLLEYYGRLQRNMWCTGGFLHAAGFTVLKSGEIAPLGTCAADEVFSFVPIEVTCDADGRNDWQQVSGLSNRYIYRVNDEALYQSAMTKALKTIVSWL